MKKMVYILIVSCIVLWVGALQAAVLVYEGFDYLVADADDLASGLLDGKNLGTGFDGPWIQSYENTNNASRPFIYGPEGNTIYPTGQNPGQPNWDGVVDNLPQTGNYVGFTPMPNPLSGDRLNAHRPLAASAGDMAGPDGVLWASMAVHMPTTPGGGNIGFVFTTGTGFWERCIYLKSLDGAYAGNGIGIANGSANWNPSNDIDTVFIENGKEVAGANHVNISRSQDNVVVLKFEFGATDTVSAWYFTEDQEMTEAAFNANAAGTTHTIDEFTLTTLAVGMNGYENAYDEIRIGDTFNDVAGILDPTLATVDAGSNWATWSGEPVTLDDVTVVSNDPGAGGLTLQWTTVPPVGVSVSIVGYTTAQPQITVTKPLDDTMARVLCSLTVSQAGKDDVIANMWIHVYDDECNAALGIGSHTITQTDFNGDCITDMEDLYELVSNWMADFSLTGSFDK